MALAIDFLAMELISKLLVFDFLPEKNFGAGALISQTPGFQL
jgi:hypothetical protein